MRIENNAINAALKRCSTQNQANVEFQQAVRSRLQ